MNSKERLEHLKSRSFNLITSIKSFDFRLDSLHHHPSPETFLKSRLATIIRNSYIHNNWNRWYKYLVWSHEGPIWWRSTLLQTESTLKDFIKMLEFLVNNIFLVFEGKVFQLIICIVMGTNCTPLLAKIFLYSYEAEFIQFLLSFCKKQLASQFNFTYRYSDDIVFINNPDLDNYIGQM